MGRQDIHAVIKAWVEAHNWPTHAGIRLGPATCGIGRCRKKHAYARSGLSDHDKIPIIYWTYERPCDIAAPMGADRAKP
ncbi:hypothetical protein LCGC14_1740300 [marine sediment metagenome]|uniref:Uncharacterized protein n=1 Tax=marine sediment metagenome TaxID=412755 RepID=A0A0F9JM66_9ZZZZ